VSQPENHPFTLYAYDRLGQSQRWDPFAVPDCGSGSTRKRRVSTSPQARAWELLRLAINSARFLFASLANEISDETSIEMGFGSQGRKEAVMR